MKNANIVGYVTTIDTCSVCDAKLSNAETARLNWQQEAANAQRELAQSQARVKELDTLYHELIMAVGQKFMGESRHETALRYIKEAEEPPFETASTESQPL